VELQARRGGGAAASEGWEVGGAVRLSAAGVVVEAAEVGVSGFWRSNKHRP